MTNRVFKSIHCTSGVHCERCRDFHGGREWRKQFAKTHNLPSVDFECKNGKEWNSDELVQIATPSDGVGDVFKAKINHKSLFVVKAAMLFSSCGDCEKLRRRMNELGPDGCEQEFDDLIEAVAKNAEKWNLGWVARKHGPDTLRESIEEVRNQSGKKKEYENYRWSIPGKAVSEWAVGITSAPRKKPTLKRCVNSVIAAGFDPTVYAEPGTRVRGVNCPVVVRPKRLGCFFNYIQTMKDLLASSPNAEAICIIQDDIVLAKDVRNFLECDLWPSDSTGVVSIYSADWPGFGDGKAEGVKRVRQTHIMGACAMVFPRRAAQRIVEHDLSETWGGNSKGHHIKNPVKRKAVDAFIGLVVKKLGLKTFLYDPSIGQHIASTSTVGHGDQYEKKNGRHYRKSVRFIGENTSVFSAFDHCQPKIRYSLPSKSVRLDSPVNVVIPAVNQLHLTEKCLDHLAANESCDLHVVYVDNGSEAGVVDDVESKLVKLGLSYHIIRFAENTGFTAAANAGMEYSKGRHVLLLNNDAFIHGNCVSVMARHLYSGRKVAAVGPLTNDNGDQSINRNDKLMRHRGLRRSVHRDYLSGFCCLKHRDAIEEIGLLEPALNHGLGTDNLWCRKAREAGWDVRLAYDAFCTHEHSSTFNALGIDRKKLQQKAVNYLNKKGA